MQNCTRPNRPDLDATKVPTELDIAWAAGIFEGEGHCRLAGKTKRGLCATVAQKDTEILYWLRDWFGGRVADNGAGSGMHVWECNGDRARIFLSLIYGRMTSRRREQIDATNALEYLRGRSAIGLTMIQLKAEIEDFYAAHKAAVAERRRKAANERGKRWYREHHLNREQRQEIKDRIRTEFAQKIAERKLQVISKSA